MIDSIPSGTWGGCARLSRLWLFQGWWASLWQVHTCCLTHSRYFYQICIKYTFSFFPQTAPTPEEMGRCDSVYLTEVGDTQVVVFKHGQSLWEDDDDDLESWFWFCEVEVQHMLWFWLLLTEKEEGAISTLVLRGSTDNLMDDIERAVDDGVNSFKILVRVSHSKESLPVLMGENKEIKYFRAATFSPLNQTKKTTEKLHYVFLKCQSFESSHSWCSLNAPWQLGNTQVVDRVVRKTGSVC